jgi:EamA-like transporter family.
MQTRAWRTLAAFAVVYLVWGSTYLAIRVGVASAPPFLFAGCRFLLAGSLLALWVVLRGRRLRPTWREARIVGITALLMLVGGNGLVTWAERVVPSDQTALLVASSALWMALFGSLGSRGEAVGLRNWLGLLLGLLGLVLLIGLGLRSQLADWSAYLALLVSPLCWAAGSIIGRRYPLALDTLSTAALQMLLAGASSA